MMIVPRVLLILCFRILQIIAMAVILERFSGGSSHRQPFLNTFGMGLDPFGLGTFKIASISLIPW
jgi:hypothetical protein